VTENTSTDGRHDFEFFGFEIIDGDEVRVRWDWDDLGPKGAQWEQRFSYDGGVTWHLNWSAAHTRADGDPASNPRLMHEGV
jgi:hypothetical protein